MSRPAAIAVTGLAAWYPGARDPRELWENVLARRQQFRAFLESRMPAADYHDPDPAAPDKTYGTQGAFLDGFSFDAAAWRVPRSTFLSTDISHWLALEVAARALADAGTPRGEGLTRDRTAVIVGNSLTGEQTRANTLRLRWPFVRRLVEAEARRRVPASEADALVEAVGERFLAQFPPTTEDTLAGALSNTIAGRICGQFDLGGGGYVVDGACASGLLAVCTAASALEEGRVDACLAGGVDISMDPFELVGFAKATALTRGEMRVYDRRGSGFIPGEGCGFVVLERLADARAAGRRVYAVLEGWGVASDGRSAITAPRVEGQARAIRQAWARAGVPDVVEGHGTGTALGDKVELTALATVAAEHGAAPRSVGVTSLKSVIGHTKAAAGIGAFLKAVIAANRRVLPPTAGCDEPHAVFDGDARALFPLRRGAMRAAALRVGASAMGFGGINTHVVVSSGDAPDPSLAPSLGEAALLASSQDEELFVLGAPDEAALRVAARALAPVAAQLAGGELVDLSAALIERLPASSVARAAVAAATPAELARRLEQLAAGERAPGVHWGTPSGPPRVAFLCPGQGSQQVDAARELVDRDPRLRRFADELGVAAAAGGCGDLAARLHPPVGALDAAVARDEVQGLAAALADTRVAQPALVATSLLWARRLAELGVRAHAVAGHSLGELSAFAVAGALTPEEAMRVAARRGAAMAADPSRPAGMVSLAASVRRAEALCAGIDGYLAVANVNGPEAVVVAGEDAALVTLVARAEAEGIAARRLAVSNAFHSALVDDAAAQIAADGAIPATAGRPTCALLSTLVEPPLEAGVDLRGHLAAHVRAPVDFVGLVRRMALQADLMLEVGSGRVLSGLVTSILGPGRCLPVASSPGRAADLNAALAAAWVAGVDVRWEALHTGRLVRALTPAAERSFIANPCEVGRTPEAPRPRVEAPIAAAPAASVAPRAAEAGPAAAGELTTWMLSRVAERAGYDVDTLSADQRLQDDLGLDSIKAGELIAAAARRVGVADRFDPAQVLREPISAIASLLSEAAGGAAPPAEAPEVDARGGATPTAPAAEEPVTRWVRTFGLVAEAAEVPAGPSWSGARVVWRGDAVPVDGLTVGPDGDAVVAVIPGGELAARVGFLRAVVEALRPEVRELLLVQRLDGRFGLEGVGVGAAGAAFARSISLERPGLAVRVVDVAAELDDAALAKEIGRSRPAAPGLEAHGLAAAGRVRLVARPIRVAPSRVELQPGDLVLVTGGAKGITAACAEALALRTGVRLLLVGSTPAAAADEEIVRTLGRLALQGIEARYRAVDLGDAEAVAALVREAGPFAAVVHGAGRNVPRRVETVSADEALKEIGPKLAGGLALLRALEAAPPRLVVGLTSIIGVSGMAGNAWYAFANEALDLALADFGARHPSTRVASLAFGVWSEVGMGARMGSVGHLARLGIGALTPAQGVGRFLDCVLGDAGVRQPIVTGHLGGLPTWPAAWPAADGLRFLEGDVRGVPGVEVTARVTLRPERDAWLRDHVYRGSMLLPTVFGLEAMAQAAAHARGGADVVVEVTDVELPAPVVVPDAGAVIELRALVREDDPSTVDCEVRTEQTGFSRAHFSATLRFAPTPTPAEAATLPTLPAPEPALDPRGDLYGGLLFQGPTFHRMGPVRGGEGRRLVFDAEVRAPVEGRWVLGDPMLRDALLQAGQVLVARDEALPVRIARLELAAGHDRPGEVAVDAAIVHTSPDGRRHTGAVDVVRDGRRLQRLFGYEVAVLSHHPERPDTAQILRPGDSAEVALRAMVAAVAPEADVQVVETDLGTRPQGERRARERELVPGLGWDGARPILADGRPVSLTHDDHLLVVARGLPGVDVEAVRPRDWEALVGPARARLLPELRRGGDLPDVAGARLWTVGEALFKAGAGEGAPTLARREGDRVWFSLGAHRAVTLVLPMPRGPARVVALAFPAERVAAAAPSLPPDLVGVRLEGGRMVARFVVSFDESGSTSGRVPAHTLATWMGRLRELALTTVAAPLRARLASGRDGMVTQDAWVRLTGEATALDAVEAAVWVEDLRPTTCQLRFQFVRVDPDGARFGIGEAAQRFGWVEVLGHGRVRTAPFPEFLHGFLSAIEQGSGHTLRPLQLPSSAPVEVMTVTTSSVDSNVVGNLYYAGYFKWAARAVDRLMARQMPSMVRAGGREGEVRLTSLRLEHLREAMPFDELEVALHPAAPEGDDLAWLVVFQRREAGGAVRLAVGRVGAEVVDCAEALEVAMCAPAHASEARA